MQTIFMKTYEGISCATPMSVVVYIFANSSTHFCMVTRSDKILKRSQFPANMRCDKILSFYHYSGRSKTLQKGWIKNTARNICNIYLYLQLCKKVNASVDIINYYTWHSPNLLFPSFCVIFLCAHLIDVKFGKTFLNILQVNHIFRTNL